MDGGPEDRAEAQETERAEGAVPSKRRAAAVAGAVLAIAVGAIIGIEWYRGPSRAPAPSAGGTSAAAPAAGPSGPVSSPRTASVAKKGKVLIELHDVALSPAARMQAEKFRCICGSGLSLAECTCGASPGSVEMKRHLQALVDRKLSPAEIEREMVAKFGPAVLP